MAAMRFRIFEETRGNHAILARKGCEQIEASLDQVEIAEGRVVGQRLQAQITNPQAPVALGTVFEDRLHAVPQGRDAHRVDLGRNCGRSRSWSAPAGANHQSTSAGRAWDRLRRPFARSPAGSRCSPRRSAAIAPGWPCPAAAVLRLPKTAPLRAPDPDGSRN